MRETLLLTSRSPDETERIGFKLGKRLGPGDLVALIGDLGVGKTCLARGIARGLEVDRRYFSSPSFIILNLYPGRCPLYHVDLYRIDDPEEIEELGILEMAEEGVCVIEWAEKILHLLPPERIEVRMEWVDELTRRIELTAMGEGPRRVLEGLRREGFGD